MIVNDRDCQRIEVRKIGQGGHETLVVDDFFRDPEAVRSEALAQPYAPPGMPYPGVVSEPDWDFRDVTSVVSHWLGLNLRREQFQFRLSMVTLKGSELHPAQRVPHVDPVLVAGLIYLSDPALSYGGTAFYRHRATGVEYFPASPDPAYLATMRRHGFENPQQWIEALMTPSENPEGYLSDSNRDWELIELIPMKFNRLVVYNGKLFHSGYIKEQDFGEALEERRLTLNFFVNDVVG